MNRVNFHLYWSCVLSRAKIATKARFYHNCFQKHSMVILIKQTREIINFSLINRAILNANGPETFRKQFRRSTRNDEISKVIKTFLDFTVPDASKPIWHEERAMFCRKQLKKSEELTVINKELPNIVARSARKRATIFTPSSIAKMLSSANFEGRPHVSVFGFCPFFVTSMFIFVMPRFPWIPVTFLKVSYR